MNNAIKEQKKIDYIDALRGFAIFGVILAHTSQWFPVDSYVLAKISSQGVMGVQLFFLVSAFTLFLSMKSRKVSGDSSMLQFFVRRFFRVAPAFYLGIIGYVTMDSFPSGHWAPNGLEPWFVAMTALFLHGWHPETINSVVPGGWSIAVEMTFYLTVPYLFSKLVTLKSALFALLLSLALSQVLSLSLHGLLNQHYPAGQRYLVDSFFGLWFFSQLPVFLLGVCVYHLSGIFPRRDSYALLLLFGAVLITFLISFIDIQSLTTWIPGHVLFSFAFVQFILFLGYWPTKWLVNGFTIWAGRLSFSMYLVHFILIAGWKNIFNLLNVSPSGDMGFVVVYFLVLLSSMVVAYPCYRLIEIPGINLGKKINAFLGK